MFHPQPQMWLLCSNLQTTSCSLTNNSMVYTKRGYRANRTHTGKLPGSLIFGAYTWKILLHPPVIVISLGLVFIQAPTKGCLNILLNSYRYNLLRSTYYDVCYLPLFTQSMCFLSWSGYAEWSCDSVNVHTSYQKHWHVFRLLLHAEETWEELNCGNPVVTPALGPGQGVLTC